MNRCFQVVCTALVYLLISSAAFGQSVMFQPGTAASAEQLESVLPIADPDPQEVRELLRLLSDASINQWLQQQLVNAPAAERGTQVSLRDLGDRQLRLLRERVSNVADATLILPQLPGELATRWSIGMSAETTLRSLIYLIIFLFIGCAMEWLYWAYATSRLRQLELSDVSGLAASTRRASAAGLLRLGGASLFSISCIGIYLVFDWPAMAGSVVLSVLFVAVILRMVLMVVRVVFSPASDHMRMVPLDKSRARSAVRWIVGICAIGLVSRVSADTFVQLGVSEAASIAVHFIASLCLAAAVIAAIWRWHAAPVRASFTDTTHKDTSALSANGMAGPLMGTVLVVVVLCLDTLDANVLKWILLVLLLLVPAIRLCRTLVDYYFDRVVYEKRHVSSTAGVVQNHSESEVSVDLIAAAGDVVVPEQRPEQEREQQPAPTANGAQHTAASAVAVSGVADVQSTAVETEAASSDLSADAALAPGTDDPSTDDTADKADSYLAIDVYRPVTQRLIRFCIIVTSVLLLFAVLGVPVWSLYSSSSVAGKAVAALIDIAAVLLMADLLWVWTKTVIDRRLADYEQPAHGQTPGPGARMATLLPLVRKVILVLISIMVVLVLLSSLGVNIAPLLAGAGVVGIAVGFGAQALVKDVVSGVFFLFEDAFRVGEYIEVGDLRGTVESISVRSFRVRHHLGAVHTIPYGELSSLTNHSRDWAIIKMQFRVPFETDLKMVKKIVKKIGAELQANEVYGHHILEPLKSQGVRRMEEFNMVVGVKFMSAPGEQWTIRRDAYQAIRDAFDKNGLSFAERSVKVEVVGDAQNNREAIAAAAQDAVENRIEGPAVVDDTP